MAVADGAAGRAFERLSLCFSAPSPGLVLQGGDPHFSRKLIQFYPAAEGNAAEDVVQLKSRLNAATNDEFWATATRGIAGVVGAQYAFVSKRILASDQDVPVEMPPIGSRGSCLMAMAYYWNDGKGAEGTVPDVKYEAYAAPCAYMKHDKVFIIPGNCDKFTPHDQNPNAPNLVNPIASYIAVPLFSDGKCFAHFGVAWSEEGERQRKLGWGFLEMVLHSLEDTVLQKVLQGDGLAHKLGTESPTRTVVPHEAVAASQSLKPYARSLSHELRTPMQGVVGMLDVMHASVQEALEGLRDERLRRIFSALRGNIETVQDSSRRAVEAADNVVHAYDMNMGVPETACTTPFDEVEEMEMGFFGEALDNSRCTERRPEVVVTGSHMPISFNQGRKRKCDSTRQADQKRRKSMDDISVLAKSSDEFQRAIKLASQGDNGLEDFVRGRVPVLESPPCIAEQGIVPGLRHTNIRDVLQYVVNDALRVGGRPDSAIAEQTGFGETIEVRVTHPNGEQKVKIIEWAVDPAVPETMLIDEKDFAKMISCVFLNAVKFTDEGRIGLTARLTSKSRYIIISCTDSGPGIPENFLPLLFKPFSREDDSLTRQSEGLGLGLLVAKGLARKLRGDVVCVRADTRGPNHGCEFEMRVPITPGDATSRPGSPFVSPAPSRRSRHRSVESEGFALDARSSVSLRHTNSPQPSNDTAPTSVPTSVNSPCQALRPSPATSSPHPSILPPALQLPTPEAQSSAHNGNRGSSASSPQLPASAHANGTGDNLRSRRQSTRPRTSTSVNGSPTFDRDLAKKHPLTFLVAEDNKINRRLLVNMLAKLGYTGVYEAYDGADAVRQMEALAKGQDAAKESARNGKRAAANGAKTVDVILMDLWMPLMDGYEATERILGMARPPAEAAAVVPGFRPPTVLAVTADVTDGALERATRVGMKGFMTKPYQLKDLERLIVEFAANEDAGGRGEE